MFGLSNLWLYGIVAAAVLGLVGVQQYRVNSAHTETATVKLQMADLKAVIADERAEAEAAARVREREHAAEMATIAETHEKELQDVQVKSEATAADLLSGQRRLRNQWQGCVADSRVPEANAAAVEPDANAELRRAGAIDLIGAADRCDAQVRGLQSVIQSYIKE